MITEQDIFIEILNRRQRTADYCQAAGTYGRSNHFVRDDRSENEVKVCLDRMKRKGLLDFVADTQSGTGKPPYVTPPSYIKIVLTLEGEAALNALRSLATPPTP